MRTASRRTSRSSEDRKEFAEIPMGAATTVVFEVQLHDDVLRRPSRIADLGDVQLRWVTPKSGLTNRQSVVHDLAPERRTGIVWRCTAWSSPLSWPWRPTATAVCRTWTSVASTDIRRDLQALSDRLQSLNGQLGHLDSYKDFAFLLDHMIAALPSDIRTSTGYSR